MPIVTMAQIGLDGTFNFQSDAVNYWPLQAASALADFQLVSGDIIVAMTDVTPQKNLIGRMVQVTEEGPLLLNQRVGLLRVSADRIDPYFLRAISNSSGWRTYARAVASLGVQANISTTDILSGKLALPSLHEQRAIATALSDVDALIAGLEKLIVKKRDLKQAAMQQLLTGQTRLPGFSGEWEIKTLNEISDVIDPHPSHRAPDTVPNGVTFVGIGDLDENGNIVGKKLRLVDPAVLAEHATRYDLKEGLIGLGRVASIGKVVSLKNGPSEYAISPTLGIIRGRDVQREFLIQSLKTEFITEQFLKIMSGSTRSSVGMEVLRLLKIFVPPSIEEQKAIALALADVDAELLALESRLAKTRDLKEGMMQELLTGRTRLV